MNRLIRMLKFAYAAETAAYHAYEGHWRSVSNKAEQEYIQRIQLDELNHIRTIEKMLNALGSKPNKFLTLFGKIIGEILGILCFYTGWRLPMYIASIMEKIGTSSYKKIAIEASESNRPLFAVNLLEMATVEEEHRNYFDKLRNKT